MKTAIDSDPTVTCYCGHVASFEAFTSRPVTGDLPTGCFQCPKCSRAWQVRRRVPKLLANGYLMPGEQTLEPISPTL